MSENPFFYPGAITNTKFFHNREREIDNICSLINKSQSVSIVGPSKIGKTSLLFKIKEVVKERYLVVNIDLRKCMADALLFSSLPSLLPLRIFSSIIKEILVEYEEARRVVGNIPNVVSFEMFEASLNRITTYMSSKKVVLLLDEFEVCTQTQSPQLDSVNFFGPLASLAPSIAIYITSTQSQLYEVLYDKTYLGSPFFSIFAPMTLGLFSKEEAESLIIGFSKGRLKEECEFIINLAGNHPLFIQCLCYHLYEYKRKTNKLNKLELDKIKEEFRRYTEGYYYHFFRQLSLEEQNACKEILEGKLPDKPILLKLKEKALVCEENSQIRLFSSSFKGFIKERMIGT